ncbi:MAG: BlaI/MecI/CopY family transcriptional regulator [Bacteroidaceae bacterium]|nr:BlaI/MecI/CopY family transcriptional regulator [Bacteroidaceae bacterium]
MNEKKTMKPLTKAEMEVMNVLWDAEHAMTVSEIVEGYAEPRPAYTTVATFLKILEAKGYVEHKKKVETGRTFFYSPMLSREKYIRHVVNDVKDTLFGSSVGKFCSFLIQNEELTDEELKEILSLIQNDY